MIESQCDYYSARHLKVAMTGTVRKRQLKSGVTSDKRPAPPRRMSMLLARLARRVAASVVNMQCDEQDQTALQRQRSLLIESRRQNENSRAAEVGHIITPARREQRARSPDAAAFAS
eukprot:5722903-Amphidinium_carterae.1